MSQKHYFCNYVLEYESKSNTKKVYFYSYQCGAGVILTC